MERLCWKPLPAEAIITDVKEVQHFCLSFVHLKVVFLSLLCWHGRNSLPVSRNQQSPTSG